MALEHSEDLGSDPSAPANRASDTPFGARYRLIRPLRQGQGVETLLATDVETGAHVVIKRSMGSAAAVEAGASLENEARALSHLDSPALARLIGFGADNGLPYLVMPFIPGTTLAERLEEGPIGIGAVVRIACCLMEALEEAHTHGVLHRDVKPSNVVVDDSEPGHEHATLLDFGFARLQRVGLAEDVPVGTARYSSPEVAGLIDHDVDERSDLYSAGVVLFECLAGRPPFLGATVGEVLRQHLSERPPGLRSLGCQVPAALDDVVQRLLRKDPDDRYASAGAVLEDLQEVAAALDRGIAEPAVVVGIHDRRRTVAEPVFVGRAQELRALEAELQLARRGRGRLALVEAESGGGKSRLLEEMAQRAAQHGAWVVRGQGLDQAAQRPFQVLDGVVRALVGKARSDPRLADRLRNRLGTHCQAVADAIPQLAEIVGSVTAASLGPELYGEARSLPALSALLHALGVTVGPTVVLLDDCQWADELTLKLLGRWLADERDQEPSSPVLVVAAFRSEEVSAGHTLRRLSPVTHLVLPRFGGDELQLMLASMAGVLPFEALDVVERLSDRNPFMATAVLRGLVETGALIAGPSGWTVDSRAMADVQTSRHAAAFLVRRIELLPEPALHLLSVGAVLGKQFDRDMAGELASQTPAEAAAVVEDARRRQILWVTHEQCTFVHDKLRETLLARLPATERQRLHRLAAHAIEAQDPMRVFELAYHFDAAGETVRALPYALTAAGQARSQHALEVAERHYEIAERAAEGGDPTTRKQAAEGLGEVLMLRGRYEDAARRLESARDLAQTAVESAQIQAKLGELAFKQGDVEGASGALEQGLTLLGRRVPRRSIGFVLAALWEVLVQAFHTLFPRFFVGRRPLDDAGADMLASRLYSRLAYAYWFQRGRTPCLWTHLRGMNLAERYQPSLELAQHYSEHAPVMTMIPYFSRGIVYVEKSLAIRRSFGDVWGHGQSMGFYGTLLYSASRYEEAIEKCREAVALLERTGDRWEVNTSNWHVAFALYRLGRLGEAVDAAQRVHRAGMEIGDHQASAISLGVWSKASGGDVPAHLIAEELQRPDDDVHTRAELLQAEGVRLLAAGRGIDAIEALTKARRMVKQKGLQQEYVAPILPWLATALRREAENAGPSAPARRDAFLHQARVAARRGVRLARKYRNNLPHAAREQALIAAAEGHPRRARKLLDRSIAVAEAQGARREEAQSRVAWGRLGIRHGWPGAAAVLAQGEAAAQELAFSLGEGVAPPEVTLSLVDRFESLLEVGQRLASALTPEAIYEAVQEAALTLLRSEHCTVVSVSSTPASGPSESGVEQPARVRVVGGNDQVFSDTLVERALREGRPVVLDEGLDADAGDSLILPQVRSALCVPIFVRRKPAACLYVAHGQVGALFSEDEKRLGLFIATLAGTALENAQGFADIHALSRSLEKRVRERTAELATANRELVQQSAAVTLLQAVAAAANQASSVEPAMKLAMAHVCRYAGWPVAHVRLGPTSAGDGLATHLWHTEEGSGPDGLLVSLRESDFFAGEGLGLRVQEAGRPVWVCDMSADDEASTDDAGRLPAVAAMASPILAGDEVVGALEFFAPHVASEDGRLLELTMQVGTELGRVVERQRAETALRASEARTRSIVETANQAFIGMDERGLILDWNREAELTFGWSRDEAIGLMVSSIVPQLKGDGAGRGVGVALASADREGAGGRMEVLAVHRDDHEFPAELTMWSVPGGGAPIFYAFLRDITERRQAEDRRRASERRLREAQQLARLGSWEWDVATDALTWSPELYAIYGLKPGELAASYEGFMARVHPDDRPVVSRVISDALRGGKPFEFEHRITRPDGEVRVIQARGEPVLDGDGVPIRMVGTGQDVTEARESEHRLQRAYERLAGTVQELERHDREVSVINQMGDMLQSCVTEPEAYAVIAQFAGRLFPDDVGGMAMVAPGRDLLEDLATWGPSGPSERESQGPSGPSERESQGPGGPSGRASQGNEGSAEALFASGDCWALRRGQVHIAGERAGSTLWCPHIGDTAAAESICVPMVAQGETLGLLHLQRATEADPTLESRSPLAVSVADHVSLALANLRLRETLREQSLRDPLTGLYNRRHLMESLERGLRRAFRGGEHIAVIVIDVDRFKQVNDELGHEAGDELLRDLGELMQANVRGEDVACRYGGEEFVLMLRHAPLKVAVRRAEELRAAARDLGTGRQRGALMSLSLGVAVFPDHGRTSEDLLRAADAAMYRAKTEGRDRVVVATPPA